MNPNVKLLVDHANATGKMHISTVVSAIESDENTFWEFFANNNPAGIIACYKLTGAPNLPTHPHMNDVYPILRNLMDQKNYKELGYLLVNVPYQVNANNFTTNSNLWNLLGVAEGDYPTLFKTYYPQQYALTTIVS